MEKLWNVLRKPMAAIVTIAIILACFGLASAISESLAQDVRMYCPPCDGTGHYWFKDMKGGYEAPCERCDGVGYQLEAGNATWHFWGIFGVLMLGAGLTTGVLKGVRLKIGSLIDFRKNGGNTTIRRGRDDNSSGNSGA